MNTLMKRKNKKGFTLVELVIVIAVLAILAAIAIPTVTNVINTANTNTDAANCQTVELALKSAHAEATAKTWTGAPAPDALTVADALKHEGLDLKTLESGLKTGSHFYYASTGSKIAGLGKISVSTGDNFIQLSDTTKVADYLAGIATTAPATGG